MMIDFISIAQEDGEIDWESTGVAVNQILENRTTHGKELKDYSVKVPEVVVLVFE